MRGEAPHDELDLLVLDQLLGPLGPDGRLELIVAEEHLHTASEHSASRVHLLHRERGAALEIIGERRERPRQRQRKPDADRLPVLRAQDGRHAERRGAGGGGSEK